LASFPITVGRSTVGTPAWGGGVVESLADGVPIGKVEDVPAGVVGGGVSDGTTDAGAPVTLCGVAQPARASAVRAVTNSKRQAGAPKVTAHQRLLVVFGIWA
jgi:hypothetical protein